MENAYELGIPHGAVGRTVLPTLSWAFPAGAREAVPRVLGRFHRNPAGFALGTPPGAVGGKFRPSGSWGVRIGLARVRGSILMIFNGFYRWTWKGPGPPNGWFGHPPWAQDPLLPRFERIPQRVSTIAPFLPPNSPPLLPHRNGSPLPHLPPVRAIPPQTSMNRTQTSPLPGPRDSPPGRPRASEQLPRASQTLKAASQGVPGRPRAPEQRPRASQSVRTASPGVPDLENTFPGHSRASQSPGIASQGIPELEKQFPRP